MTPDLLVSIATPCFAQVRPSCRSWSPSWRQLAATSPRICQKRTLKPKQLKRPQICTKLAQNSCKITSQTLENQAKVMDCCSFSYFSLFPPTCKKRHQKVSKLVRNRSKRSYKVTKLAILAASWRLLGATCCQLDPNLVHFASSCCQALPKSCQKANPETKTTQENPNLRQPCPKQLKNHSPDLRKSSKSDGLLFVFILFAIPTHPQKKTPKGCKIS
jgi:hypothetical protein